MSHMIETTLEDWAKLLAVNLWSIIHMVNAFAPKMIERGSGQVVNISSGQAFFAVPMWGAYACTKFAVDGYSEALRYELFWHGIGVTTVFPGIVKTPFYETITGGAYCQDGHEVAHGGRRQAGDNGPHDSQGDKEEQEARNPAHNASCILPQANDAVDLRRSRKGRCLGAQEGGSGHRPVRWGWPSRYGAALPKKVVRLSV